MYSDIFCKVYNEFGWNYYPEAFGQRLLEWMKHHALQPKSAMDLACGTGILCGIMRDAGISAAGMDLSGGMIEIARQAHPGIPFYVADMTLFAPEERFDLVTCTGDAINHIPNLSDVEKIFRNVYGYTTLGGYFIFDILDEKEVSDSEPFEMNFDTNTKVWFQMTRPGPEQVHLKIRVYAGAQLQFEEIIRETIHDPAVICQLLEKAGFTVERCDHNLLPADLPATTWFVIARK